VLSPREMIVGEIPSHVREYASTHEQVPIVGGWLIRYVRDFDRVDRVVYCETLHSLAMHLSDAYRRAQPQPEKP
jgi:hypothetical protein